MKNITINEEKVGILLANGFTKKEVACKLQKSIPTICHQTDSLYKKSESRNLADLTRFMVRRYTNVAVEDILIRAMHDITIITVVCLTLWAANTLGAFEQLEVALQNISSSIISTVSTILTK